MNPARESSEGGNAGANVQELFRTYVDAWDEGRETDLADLYRQAGDDAPKLKQKIAALELLNDLSETIGSEVVEVQPEAEVRLERLGRFEDLKPIGRGGSSRVYLAYDPQLARRVALKVLIDFVLDDERSRAWILNEGRSMAKLTHAGVVRVFEVGTADDRPFIAMEHVDGPSLQAVLDHMRSTRGDSGQQAQEGEQEESEPDPHLVSIASSLDSVVARCHLIVALARALAYGHSEGVIHRDVKPGNVLLAAPDDPKLIDFGLAHLSDHESHTRVTQDFLGTPAYLSPEQAEAKETGVNTASDQFSLGVILYELLTLENPFIRPGKIATLHAIAKANPPRARSRNSAIPEDLDRICMHCLEVRPEDRYGSIEELASDLEAFLDHRSISLQAPSVFKLLRLSLRRNRVAVGWAVAGLLLFLASLIGVRSFELRADRDSLRADFEQAEEALFTIESPAAFQRAFGTLRDLRVKADRVDEGLLAGILFPPLAGELTEIIHTASGKLAEGIAADKLVRNASESEPRKMADLLVPWSAPLGLEQSLCPQCPANQDDHERGQVSLPELTPDETLTFMRTFAATSNEILMPETTRNDGRLQSGYYCVQIRDNEGELDRERCFNHYSAELKKTIDVQPLAGTIAARLVEIEGGEEPYRILDSSKTGSGGAWLSLSADLDSFAIMSSLVTWGDLAEAFGDKKAKGLKNNARIFQRLNDEALQVDSPAIVPHLTAQEFADVVGARLPSLMELHRAMRDERISQNHAGWLRGEVSSTSDSDIDGYRYLSYPIENGQPVGDSTEAKTVRSWYDLSPRNGFSPYAFRIARSR